MGSFKLSNKAVEDLSEIWEYTFETWSEKQADIYYTSLISSCQKIANHPHKAKSYDGIILGLFGKKVNRHIIFYRIINDGSVEIIRILHEIMDLKNKFKE